MKVLVITQNYPPDLGAGAFRMKALVDVLTSRNHEVCVLTGTPNRYDSVSRSIEEDNNQREKIIRINVPQQKQDLIQRGMSYFIFFRKATKRAIEIAKQCDVIVATSPQLLVAYSGAKAAERTQKPFILDIRDLWPDVMIELNLTTTKSLVYKTLKRIERKCYKQADKIIINSPAFAETIKSISGKTPVEITNGIDDMIFKELRNNHRRIPKKPFIITYAGNLGIAQDLEVLLKAAKKTNDDFLFRLIGDGSEKQKLLDYARNAKLNNVEFIDPVPRKELLAYYENTDAFFVHLKNIDVFKKTIPSKIFEFVATGKPVIYGLQGISQQIMHTLQGDKFAFEAGNVNSLLSTLDEIRKTLETTEDWNGLKGIEILKERFLRSSLSNKFADIIEEIAK